MGKNALRKTLLVHGEGVHMEILDPPFDLFQKVLIYPLLHIADRNVRVGTLTGLHDLHREIDVPDPAADQDGVEDQGLHKAVTGPAEHLVFFRF